MSIQLYTYKFKLEPTRLQAILLNKHCGASRFVYNYFLNLRKNHYQTENKGLSYNQNSATLTELKKVEATGWLKEVNSQSLQYGLKSLDTAFDRFFKKKADFPNFHSKFKKNTFRVPQNTRIVGNKLIVPKFLEGIKLIAHRPVVGEIKFSTISKEPTGEYFVAITVEKEVKELPKTDKIVGIDLGIKDLIICSDKTIQKNPKNTYKFQIKLKKIQQHLSAKKKGSGNRVKARLKVAKIHKKITNSRKDAIHKATTNLVRNNDVIVMESLKARNMVKNRKLAKAVSDASFGEIRRQLEYKCLWYGKVLIKIGTFYPSSKTCSKCGWINQNLSLSDRHWTCSQCATKHDRDFNASINILQEGLRNISSGTGDYTCGANVSLDFVKQMALKQEAQGSLALE
jgi:putative transposase